MIRKIKSIFSRLLNTGFWHIFGTSVLNKIISFSSSIILVRILTKVEYGNYSYVINIVNMFSLFSGLGVVSGILQLCSENIGNEKRQFSIYRYGCKIGIYTNVILGVFMIIYAIFVPMPIKGSWTLLLLLSFLPLITLLYNLQITFLRAKLLNKEFAYSNTINTSLIFVFSILGAFLWREFGMAIGQYVAYTITILIVYHKYQNSVGLNREIKQGLVDKILLLKVSIISMVNNGVSQLLHLLDIFMIGIVVSDSSIIASYKIATIVPSALYFIPQAVITYVYPLFSKNRENKTWVKNKYLQLTIAMGVFNLLIVAALVGLAPLCIQLVFGEQYLDAVLPFRLLTIGYGISGTFQTIAGNILVTQRELKFNFFVACVSGSLNIIGNFYFINQLGATGAAIATLLVIILISILNVSRMIYVLNKKEKQSHIL